MTLEGFESDCMEIKLTIEPGDASLIWYSSCSARPEARRRQSSPTTPSGSSSWWTSRERARTRICPTDAICGTIARASAEQVVPFPLAGQERLDIDVFVDRSIIEMFVNSRVCIVQRVYPTRDDSKGFRLFTEDRPIVVKRHRQVGDGHDESVVNLHSEGL